MELDDAPPPPPPPPPLDHSAACMPPMIVGHYRGQPIFAPLNFPPPPANIGGLFRARITFPDGRLIEKNALMSKSGRFYELDRTLKEAIYGSVVMGLVLEPVGDGMYRQTGERVAIKIISKVKWNSLRGQSQENPEKEISVMHFTKHSTPTPVRHENLVNLIECCHDRAYIFSIMEFIDGMELFDYIDSRGSVPEDEARGFFLDILAGVRTLHGLGICHRDMSLENLMLTSTRRCIIIDYGMALRAYLNEDNGEFHLFPKLGQCGKRNFMAPEVVSNEEGFNGALADMWALGVILFMLLTGVPPVDIASPLDARFVRISNGRLGQMLIQWNIVLSPSAVDLLSRMLRPTPLDRLTISQIYEHPWIVNT